MKIEFTRAEVEKMVLFYVNNLIPTEQFHSVRSGHSYREIPDTIVVSTEKDSHAAQ